MRSYYEDDYDDEEKGAAWPEILTIRDVQMYLGVGERTIYRLIQSGELPAFRIGKLWRIKRKELEKYCENH